jgi:hypothetical protein
MVGWACRKCGTQFMVRVVDLKQEPPEIQPWLETPQSRLKLGLGRMLPIPRVVNTVTCDSADGSGCGTWWIEKDGEHRSRCPKCGKKAVNGNIIVNDGEAPNVMGLHSEGVLVVGDEQCLKATISS